MLTIHEALVTAVAAQLRMSREAVEHALEKDNADLRPGTTFHSVQTAYQAGQEAIKRVLLDMEPTDKVRAHLFEMGIGR